MLKPMTVTDPVVQAALNYLQSQVETNRRGVGGDMSIRIFRMVEKIPLTIEQYWSVAAIWLSGQTKLMKEQRADWLLVEAWQLLTDWTPTDKALFHLVDSAPENFHNADDNVEVMNVASWLAPTVSWNPDTLADWMGRHGAMVAVWSADAISSMPGVLHDLVLAGYLQQSIWHECLTVDTVKVLIEARQWSPNVLQAGMTKYMDYRKHEYDCVPQTHLVLNAWLDTFVWTPDTANDNILAIDKTFQSSSVWLPYIDKIGQGLKCLTGIPGALQATLALLTRAGGTNAGRQQAQLQAQLSSAAGPLPSAESILANLSTDPGCLLLLLANPVYSVDQRLEWLRSYSECLVASKRLAIVLPRLESPLREAVALSCVLQATSPGANKDAWKATGVSISNTAGQTKFLNVYAPELKSKIATVRSLDVAFSDALEMYLQDCGYRAPVEPGELPSLGT